MRRVFKDNLIEEDNHLDCENTFQERSSRTSRTNENIQMLWLEFLIV